MYNHSTIDMHNEWNYRGGCIGGYLANYQWVGGHLIANLPDCNLTCVIGVIDVTFNFGLFYLTVVVTGSR